MRVARMSIVLVLASACLVPEEDDTALMGRYDVVETLASHGCGQQAIPTGSTVRFDATIRRFDNDVAQWSVPRGSTVNGTVRGETMTFTLRSTRVVRPAEPGLLDPGCALVQDETLALAPSEIPDGGVPMPPDGGVGDAGPWQSPAYDALEGTHRIDFRPSAGSDCAGELTTSGGGFQAIPCAIQYDVTATR